MVVAAFLLDAECRPIRAKCLAGLQRYKPRSATRKARYAAVHQKNNCLVLSGNPDVEEKIQSDSSIQKSFGNKIR